MNNFNNLCFLLNKITTPSEARGEIATFLKDLDVESQIITCNFLLGQPIEGERIGYSSKTVQKVLTEKYGITEFNTKSLGNLFLNVNESKYAKYFLTLKEVYKMYGDLFAVSSDKERTLYLKLLDLPNKQKRWFVDILLDKLQVRLGFNVLKHSLAEVYGVKVEIVEHAWNMTQSITKTMMFLNGEELKIEIGTPISSQLAKDVSTKMDRIEYPCQVEGKYDGFRAQVHIHDDGKIQIFSRSMKEKTDIFPDIALILSDNKTAPGIYDGEIYGINPDYTPMPFEKFQHRINVKEVTEEMLKEYPATIVLFDIIYNKYGDHNYVQFQRMQSLEQYTSYYSPWRIVDNERELLKSYGHAIEMGYEGIMIKNMYGYYKPGEGKTNWGNWLKYKPAQLSFDVVVIGAHMGTGDKRHVYSSFDIAILKEAHNNVLYPIGKVGGGFTMEDLESITSRAQIMNGVENLKLILEVKSDKIMVNEEGQYHFRFPQFIRFRNDKEVGDIDTLDMIKEAIK